jgi:F-type H+-transporting ATPase subunit b
MGYLLKLAPMIQVLASGGEGTEPHGIADAYLSHWLWTWIIFGLVFLVLYKFAFKPIREQLEARENRIRETIDKAHQVKAEAEALLDKHGELMDRAKADAQEIINQGREAAETAKNAIVQSGQEEARASVDRAKREIELETKKALDEIRRETVDLTIMAASQVIGRSLEDEDHRRLTSEVIEEMGVDRQG